ncbi:PAS domain S-box protein [Natrinema gari]|uniref:histidine kinase n=1 Tax=Natrinema gari JCM 14663 TaxID=1230459 RepID=L9YRA4_9EURY|nr:PAS domain S-box protein [Natrinema gari]ELY75438.1 PAS sensor protein [Natrinema gari JCM 14663]
MTEQAEPAVSAPWGDGDEPAAQQWYRTVVETVAGGVFQLDAADRIVGVDDTLLELTGHTRDALSGEHVTVLLGDSGGESFEAASATGVTEREGSVRTADGTAIPCELRLGTVPGSDGRRGSIGVVTEPDDGPRAASDAESIRPQPFESITTVLEEADVGVFVLDEAFDVAWINAATERYFGLDAADVVGRDKATVIDETIRDRVGDPDAFADVLEATYDDNGNTERFECRITPGDGREERWLEHRSKPISSGPYAGGRVELYYDVTEQHRRAAQLRQLTEAVREWLGTGTREAVAEQACHHLSEILDPDFNGVFLSDASGTTLEPVAWSEPETTPFDERPTFAAGAEIARRVFDSGEPVVDDVPVEVDDPAVPIRSAIGLPIGDHGVVVIGSETADAFDEGDRSLVKVAASSLEATVDRISHERSLERERSQTETILRTTPVAISVEDADGETVLANRHAQTALGLGDRGPLGETELLAEGTVVDADGDPVVPDRGPSARVRETGEPVFDEELMIEGPTGDSLWFSVTAVPVFGTDGDLERVISAGEDITALKEHERRLQRRKHELETELSEILGRVSDAFYALDDDWRFTHVNDRAGELLGYDPAALVGENIWETFPGGARSDLLERYQTAMETQQPVSWQRYSDSLDIWMEIRTYPSETGLSVYFQDITDRKRRERHLEQYERIIETIEDGIYVLDENDRFSMVNEAYADLTGYDRDELLGSHASLVADEQVMTLAQRIAAESDDPTIEASVETKSGTQVPVEATVTSIATADAGPERIGVVRDVTERQERQRRLEASEQRYRTLAENFPNGVVALFDDELRYTAAGGQLLGEIGLDREGALGQTIHERYSDELLAEVEPHFRAALDGNERTFEVTYRGRDLRATTLPVRTGDEVTAGMLVIQDITERTASRRKLEESNERLEQFAYAASHDLQEPLRMITSYLQLIEGRYADDLDADGREFIDYAVDGAERMREMIDGLLQYSRVETKGEPLEPVALDAVLADVREDLQVRIDERDAEITTDPLPRVAGDASQLRQVLQNLLSNAIEYSGDEPPRVHVSAERTGWKWEISVHDEGIGIDAEEQDRIFQVFQRLHSHEEHAGTGIGLALCHRIIERHGGEMWVDSTPGEGSTFSFTLPAADTATD